MHSFNGWGVSIVDSLDTMHMMGLHDEFQRGIRLTEKIKFKNEVCMDELYNPLEEFYRTNSRIKTCHSLKPLSVIWEAIYPHMHFHGTEHY